MRAKWTVSYMNKIMKKAQDRQHPIPKTTTASIIRYKNNQAKIAPNISQSSFKKLGNL